MGVRAVIVVHDESGLRRRFWSAWASKQYQIPHLARLVHAADHRNLPLTMDGYRAFIAAHPGTLPALDITDAGRYADPATLGDLDHRYELRLWHSDRTFRFQVQDRDRSTQGTGWRRAEELVTRAQLYEAAARMCREMATSSERYAHRHGAVPAGGPRPQDWRAEAATFTGWLSDTDRRLLHQARQQAVSDGSVPEWYAVRVAREQARRIGARLREQYPGVQVRTRVAVDGVITLTVPALLATDAEAPRIAETVGGLLGRPFTVIVRAHRRSRQHVHNGRRDRSDARRNATLTLRPDDGVAAPAQQSNSKTHPGW